MKKTIFLLIALSGIVKAEMPSIDAHVIFDGSSYRTTVYNYLVGKTSVTIWTPSIYQYEIQRGTPTITAYVLDTTFRFSLTKKSNRDGVYNQIKNTMDSNSHVLTGSWVEYHKCGNDSGLPCETTGKYVK